MNFSGSFLLHKNRKGSTLWRTKTCMEDARCTVTVRMRWPGQCMVVWPRSAPGHACLSNQLSSPGCTGRGDLRPVTEPLAQHGSLGSCAWPNTKVTVTLSLPLPRSCFSAALWIACPNTCTQENSGLHMVTFSFLSTYYVPDRILRTPHM